MCEEHEAVSSMKDGTTSDTGELWCFYSDDGTLLFRESIRLI
jgi:hypothetical protein